MKKYLVGGCAILLAIGFSAFKFENRAIRTFHFVAPGGVYSTDNVQNEANWFLGSASIDCNGSAKACEIDVNDAGVANPSATRLDLMDGDFEVIAEQGTQEAAVTDVELSNVSVLGEERSRN